MAALYELSAVPVIWHSSFLTFHYRLAFYFRIITSEIYFPKTHRTLEI